MNFSKLRTLPVLVLLLPMDILVAGAILIADLILSPLRLLRRDPKKLIPAKVASVTIQILNWDGLHLMKECLPSVVESVRRHLEVSGSTPEILVVDNGSSDGSVDYLRKYFPDVRVMTLDRNYGFSVGNNKGFQSVHADIVVLLNNDMLVAPDFLQPLLAPLSDSSVFAVSSQIYFQDPSRKREETGKTMGAYEKGFFRFWHEQVSPSEEKSAALPIFWAGGGSCAVDVRKLKEIGGFDTLYHPFYVEDTDLSWQAWKRGWKSLFAPQSHVVHKHRGTSRPRFGDAFVDSTTRRNQFLFVWKNVTEPRLILRHVIALPRIHGSAILQKGARSEIHSYVRAVARLPFALWRRVANLRDYVVSDRDVLKSLQ